MISRREASGPPHPDEAPVGAQAPAARPAAPAAQSASPVPHNAAAARDAVARLLTSHFCELEAEGLADVVVADALLVTSELVTNAFRHGGGLTRFSAELTDEGLCVAVSDTSTDTPVGHHEGDSGAARIGGYGWPLVLRLATRVSITCHSGGKRITALIPLT
ncbi:ATP-binding protein [Streptomyces sp. NBC_00859]|uniref:ATP-binding protein n=1 Tax=Streptomyces sp. NBC_00859 TaxID=2903682 RepID=UPI00386DE9F2|nr:ATP-binding protein [Streptomyces sp. NBC_00859]